MLLKRVTVHKFLGRNTPLVALFNPDINIITGYNGAGKTNLLKLIWYTVSGNINALLQEVNFQEVNIETDIYSVNIFKINSTTCRGSFISGGEEVDVEDLTDDEDEMVIEDARDIFAGLLKSRGSTIFFPTFRRIEGGFTISTPSAKPRNALSLFNVAQSKSDLEEAVHAVSRRLSNEAHTFVTSISTMDIAELLLKRFTEISETAAGAQSRMSRDVERKIREFRNLNFESKSAGAADEAVRVLDSISQLIESTDKQRELAMAPLRAVQSLGARIFRHKGIQINRRVSFGDTANAINSDLLSAGEKQMLSFICYNAFIENSAIFIDEPELSLHVDWQRTLFPTLESQKKSNQFIIATHSPFIYSKYPEKEIRLAEDRGGEVAIDE